MALLLGLLAHEYRVVIAHVNHGLRGDESDADENFVIESARQLNLPVATRRVQIALTNGIAPENAAREARYTALTRIAREHGCAQIATGHTATDTLETVLMQMVRGASVTGLAGIPRRRELEPGLEVVRPLWQSSREAARRALEIAGWKWREDSSNASAMYLRNRVRAEVLPNLATLCGDGERLARQTARAASLLRDDLEFLDDAAREALATLILREEAALLTFDADGFRALPTALQRRVLREAARKIGGERAVGGYEQIETARRHIAAQSRRTVWCWSGDLRVEWTGAMAGNRVRVWRVEKR